MASSGGKTHRIWVATKIRLARMMSAKRATGVMPVWRAVEALESRVLMSASDFTLATGPTLIAPYADAASLGEANAPAIIRSLSSGSGSGGSSSSSLTASSTQISNLSGFSIVIVAGAGLSGNAAALAAFQRGAAQWVARISDPITVYIDADLANIGSASIIGQTSSVGLTGGYDTIRNQMVADAADEADDAIVASLPTAAQATFVIPTGFSLNGNLTSTKAALKAMGFTGLDAQFGQSDATMTFNSQFAFDFDNSNGITANTMDFETVAAHEIGHALGFVSEVDTVDYYASRNQRVSFAPGALDLFRFGNGTAADPTTAAEFLSFARDLRPAIDAVTDQITTWGTAAAQTRMSTGAYTGDGRQASHWKDSLGLGIMDPTLSYGELVLVGDADARALDLIGWDIAQPGGGGTNISPTANDDTGATNANAFLTVAAPGVLANDSDSDGGTLTVTGYAATSSLGAAVVVSANGAYTYDPRNASGLKALAQGATTQDTFTYNVSDGQGGTTTATVRITVTGVNDAPVAANDSATVDKKTNKATGNVLTNDSDPDGGTITVQLVAGPTKGTLSLNTATGAFTYTPGSSFTSSDTFTYRAVDSLGAVSNIATVTITKPGTKGGPRLVAGLTSNQLAVLAAIRSDNHSSNWLAFSIDDRSDTSWLKPVILDEH